MSTSTNIILIEQQVLNCIWDRPQLIYEVESIYFLSQDARDIFDALFHLHQNNIEFTDTDVIATANRQVSGINEEIIEILRSKDYSVENFHYYLDSLKKNYAKNQIENKLLKETVVEVSSKGDLNLEKIRDIVATLEQNLDLIQGKKSSLLTASELMVDYEKEIHKRRNGELNFSSGDKHLDANITMGFAPKYTTLLFAATGLGKSVVALNLVNKQINRMIPSLYISLEMDMIATFDRLMCIRKRINIDRLYPDPETGDIDEEIFDYIKDEKRKLIRNNHFFFVEEPSLCIADVQGLIRDAKQRMGRDYLVVTIDLVTMLKDFSGKEPKEYEAAVNLLHFLARKENVHFFLVAQANREIEKHSVSKREDIRKFRPTMNLIKNSGALGERSRVVLGAFREKYYLNRYLPDDPIVDTVPDILELSILKQTQGGLHPVKYLFNGPQFSLYPFKEEEDEGEAQE